VFYVKGWAEGGAAGLKGWLAAAWQAYGGLMDGLLQWGGLAGL